MQQALGAGIRLAVPPEFSLTPPRGVPSVGEEPTATDDAAFESRFDVSPRAPACSARSAGRKAAPRTRGASRRDAAGRADGPPTKHWHERPGPGPGPGPHRLWTRPCVASRASPTRPRLRKHKRAGYPPRRRDAARWRCGGTTRARWWISARGSRGERPWVWTDPHSRARWRRATTTSRDAVASRRHDILALLFGTQRTPKLTAISHRFAKKALTEAVPAASRASPPLSPGALLAAPASRRRAFPPLRARARPALRCCGSLFDKSNARCSSACDCASLPGAVRKPQRGHTTSASVRAATHTLSAEALSDGFETVSDGLKSRAASRAAASAAFEFFQIAPNRADRRERRVFSRFVRLRFFGPTRGVARLFVRHKEPLDATAARARRTGAKVARREPDARARAGRLRPEAVNTRVSRARQSSPALGVFPEPGAALASAGNANVLLRVSKDSRGGTARALGSARHSSRAVLGVRENLRRSSASRSASSSALQPRVRSRLLEHGLDDLNAVTDLAPSRTLATTGSAPRDAALDARERFVVQPRRRLVSFSRVFV